MAMDREQIGSRGFFIIAPFQKMRIHMVGPLRASALPAEVFFGQKATGVVEYRSPLSEATIKRLMSVLNRPEVTSAVQRMRAGYGIRVHK
jgi:hypothetical protein